MQNKKIIFIILLTIFCIIGFFLYLYVINTGICVSLEIKDIYVTEISEDDLYFIEQGNFRGIFDLTTSEKANILHRTDDFVIVNLLCEFSNLSEKKDVCNVQINPKFEEGLQGNVIGYDPNIDVKSTAIFEANTNRKFHEVILIERKGKSNEEIINSIKKGQIELIYSAKEDRLKIGKFKKYFDCRIFPEHDS